MKKLFEKKITDKGEYNIYYYDNENSDIKVLGGGEPIQFTIEDKEGVQVAEFPIKFSRGKYRISDAIDKVTLWFNE